MTQIATLIFFASLVVLFFAAMSKSMAFLGDEDDTSMQNMAMAVSAVGIAWGAAVMVIYGYIL